MVEEGLDQLLNDQLQPCHYISVSWFVIMSMMQNVEAQKSKWLHFQCLLRTYLLSRTDLQYSLIYLSL